MRILSALSLVAPVIVFIAVVTTGLGLIHWRIGYDLMTVRIAWYVALVSGLAAVIAVGLAVSDMRRSGPVALGGLILSGLTIALFLRHFMAMGDGAPEPDATTNPADPPGYSSQVLSLREADGAAPVDLWRAFQERCPVAVSLPTQIAPGSAQWALEQAGFVARGVGVARADGVRESVWFGFTHDATIRIRPGQTDIRVTAREDRRDGGEACRLAQRIRSALATGR